MGEFRVCATVPVFNHAQPLAYVLEKLVAAELPVIVVDDGSDDDEARRIATLAQGYPRVSLLVHATNSGKGTAVLSGLKHAAALGFTHALQVDADGQHDLGAINLLLTASQREPLALISGMPVYDQSAPRSRRWGRYATHIWVWINTLSFTLKDSMCGFRVYPLSGTLATAAEFAIGKHMDFDTDIMVRMYWRGVPVRFATIKVTYPVAGVSHFRLLKDNLRISAMHARHFVFMLGRLARGQTRPRPT